jgi:hypothetical protein
LKGDEAFIQDCRGIKLVAFLLLHPKVLPLHATELESRALGERSVCVGGSEAPCSGIQEAAAKKLNAGGNEVLKKRLRELHETIKDDSLPQEERDAAQAKLDEILASMRKGRRGLADNGARTADRVRKAITRLRDDLLHTRNARNEPEPGAVAFGNHIEKHILLPSSRFLGTPTSRTRAGVAGQFTYEPPQDMAWAC